MSEFPVYTIGNDATVYHGDCLQVIKTLADDSVDLILTDPPYFKVKGSEVGWDHQWDTRAGFLAWIGELCKEYRRVLRPNGSLYVFASNRMGAAVELEVAKYFNILNHIVWVKEEGWYKKAAPDTLRSYFGRTERIIFAEQYSADNWAKGVAGYEAKCDEARGLIFEPLRAYLAGEIARAGFTTPQIERLMNNFMGRHWFTTSQWELPTANNYARLRELLREHGRKPAPTMVPFHPEDGLWSKYQQAQAPAAGDYLGADYTYLRADYEYLRAYYEVLKAEYEELRRPFAVTKDSWGFTDVWDFETVQGYPGKHPCEKPTDLIDHIITTSSKPGMVVLDTFMGSGVVGERARRAGRFFIGMELDEKWVHQGRARIGDAQALTDALTARAPVWASTKKPKTQTPSAQIPMFDLGSIDA